MQKVVIEEVPGRVVSHTSTIGLSMSTRVGPSLDPPVLLFLRTLRCLRKDPCFVKVVVVKYGNFFHSFGVEGLLQCRLES